MLVDRKLYAADPRLGSFEAAFEREAAEFAELGIGYDRHPPFGIETVVAASPTQNAQLEGGMKRIMAMYREGAVGALAARSGRAVAAAAA